MLSKTLQCILLCLFLLPGIGGAFALDKPYPVTVTDAMGRTVSIKRPAQRIAFSGTCLAEALKIIGVWDKVVGRGYMINPDRQLYPGIEDLAVFATDTPGPYNVNYEALLALDVDLLLIAKTPSPGFEEMNNNIKSRIQIVVLDMFLPEKVKKNFDLLAALFDAEQTANAYLAWYDHIIETISEKTSGLPPAERKRFFLKWNFGHVEEMTTISDKFPGMLATNDILGGINIAANLQSMWGGAVDPEWLMQQEIDVIVCQDRIPHGYGTPIDDPSAVASYREKVMALPLFASSRAVRQNKVYMISSQFMFSPGGVIYMAYLAKWFHPELFTDLSPQTLHQEYLTRFLHTDFDLSRHGVFVYPQ